MTFDTVCRVMEFTSEKLRQTVKKCFNIYNNKSDTIFPSFEIVTNFLVREIFIMSRRNCCHLPENVFPQAKNSEKLFQQKI